MLQDISWSPGPLAWVALAMIGLALILWFIIRRQKQRLWMPVLQVLSLEFTALPKLRWTRPPLWPLLCFALSTLALGLFAFEPSEALLKRENLDLRYTHIFFDMSPSTSLAWNSTEYAREAENFVRSLDQNSKLSFSLSHSDELYSADQIGGLSRIIQDRGFHRAGLKIGTAVESILSRSPDIEHLIVFSDRDRASWEDFNWRYLEKKVQVSWYPLRKEILASDNIFIDDVKPRDANRNNQNMSWIVSLRRSSQGESRNGKLKLEVDGKPLVEQAWVFQGDANSIEIEVSIPSASLAQLGKEDLVLLWTLEFPSENDLLIDNSFRSYLKIRSPEALIIAQPHGEMFLEDSVFHLKTALDVLGIRTKRIDKAIDVPRNAALLVAEADGGFPRSFFCPLNQQRQINPLQVWLIPSADLQDYESLCSCAAAFIQAPKPSAESPGFCKDIQTRDQYIGVLQSLGALQLGGEVNGPLGALAMQYYNASTKTRLLAFTMPLQPARVKAISYGQLPLLLKALFELSPLEGAEEGRGKWPRLEDISNEYKNPQVAMSNVPFLESSLQQLSEERLPPLLQFGSRGLLRQSAIANREKDAKPWIQICLWLVAAAAWLEIIGLAIGRVFKNRVWAARWFGLGLLLLACLPFDAEAQIRLNLFAYSKTPNLSLLRRDISARTSIDLIETVKEGKSLRAEVLSEPWLWVSHPQQLESLTAEEMAELLAWIQRGGFLLIENSKGGGAFKSKLNEAIASGVWKPIPPDHELMRSFHLLSSLPQCGDSVWEGFHFDQRIAVLLIPGPFLEALLHNPAGSCFANLPAEQSLKIFINIMMVVLTTDYKNDQIHLPEILKRLR